MACWHGLNCWGGVLGPSWLSDAHGFFVSVQKIFKTNNKKKKIYKPKGRGAKRGNSSQKKEKFLMTMKMTSCIINLTKAPLWISSVLSSNMLPSQTKFHEILYHFLFFFYLFVHVEFNCYVKPHEQHNCNLYADTVQVLYVCVFFF